MKQKKIIKRFPALKDIPSIKNCKEIKVIRVTQGCLDYCPECQKDSHSRGCTELKITYYFILKDSEMIRNAVRCDKWIFLKGDKEPFRTQGESIIQAIARHKVENKLNYIIKVVEISNTQNYHSTNDEYAEVMVPQKTLTWGDILTLNMQVNGFTWLTWRQDLKILIRDEKPVLKTDFKGQPPLFGGHWKIIDSRWMYAKLLR